MARKKPTPKPKKKAKPKASRKTASDQPSLADLAGKARKTGGPEPMIIRANTAKEMHRLSQHQQALIQSIGLSTWNLLKPREQLAVRCYLLERGNTTRAAMRAGLQRSYYYSERRPEAFKTTIKQCDSVICDLVEHDITHRGIAGHAKIVRYRGVPVPIMDPRVPVIRDPDTGKPYMVPSPLDPSEQIEFRGYEHDTEFSDTIGLHVLKSILPHKYNSPPARKIEVQQTDPAVLSARIAQQLGVDLDPSDADALDQAYKLTD